MSESPIGALIVDATKQATKKSGGHTAHATACTCEVEVAFITPASQRIRISRCVGHVLVREDRAATKKRRAKIDEES